MTSFKRLLFGIGFALSFFLAYLSFSRDLDFWLDVLLLMPINAYGMAIASRFWTHEGDRK